MVQFIPPHFIGVGDFQFFNANTVSCRRGIVTQLQSNPRCHAQFEFKVHARDKPFHQRLQLQQQRDWAEWDAACYHPDHRQSFRNGPGVNPIAYNQFTAGVSATKQFGEGFASVSATAFDIVYDHGDNNPAPFNVSHDGASVWLSGRAGYHFVPGVYAFAEVTVFGNVTTIQYSTRTDTGSSAVLGPMTKTVCSAAKFTADISFNISNNKLCPLSASRKTPTVRSLAAVSITTQRSTGR